MILLLIFTFLTYFTIINSTSSKISEIERKTRDLEFLVTNKNEIWRIQANSDYHQYYANASAISDLDYHLRKNLLFWIDSGIQEIHSQPLDTNSVVPYRIFKQQRSWQPVALAVDFIGDKIYVADILGVKIDVFELNGQHHSVVLGVNLVRPSDIKLDPYEGLIFVLDGFKIVRIDMDGSNFISISAKDIVNVHGFFIDPFDKKVYWSRNKEFKMMSTNYFGENLNSLGKNSSSSLTWSKFTFFNGSIFWASNFVHYKFEFCDERLGMPRKTIYQSNPIPTIRALHSSLQSVIPNPCEDNNGGCQHMCILMSNRKNNFTSRCACSAGWILAVNLTNCTRVSDFLMYAQSTIIKSHLIEKCKNIFCEPYLPITENKSTFIDFDYHFTDNYFYYIARNEIKNDIIYKLHPNESESEIFLLGKYENFQSLAIDWTTANLYFTDSLTGTITVVNTNNKTEKKILLENLNQPEYVILHPKKGFLFFFQTNETTSITIFSRVRTDGSNLTIFDKVPLKKLCEFSIDLNEDRIYWYEWRKNYIQHSNFDLNKVQIIRSTLTKYLYGISVHEKWIYFVTMNSEGLWRIDKRTGKQPELILADFGNRITKIKIFSPKLPKRN